MSKRSQATGKSKYHQKTIELRNKLWGKEVIEETKLWDRLNHDGFTSIPRTMPYISRIMDREAGKGTPVSGTYQALWCNVFDEAFLEITNQQRYAFESGFSGERAVSTWLNRMKILKKLGFIDSKRSVSSDFDFVLIINPLEVCKKLCSGNQNDPLYNALIARMDKVGAVFEEEMEEKK